MLFTVIDDAGAVNTDDDVVVVDNDDAGKSEGAAVMVAVVEEGAATVVADAMMGIPLSVELMRLLAVTKLTGELDEVYPPRMVAEPDDDDEHEELD